MNLSTPNNFCTSTKGSQKPIKYQDIKRLSRYQRGRLIIALHQIPQPATMKQLEAITGIDRSSICRRLAELRKMGLAHLVRYGTCPVTNYPRVGFYWKGSGHE